MRRSKSQTVRHLLEPIFLCLMAGGSFGCDDGHAGTTAHGEGVAGRSSKLRTSGHTCSPIQAKSRMPAPLRDVVSSIVQPLMFESIWILTLSRRKRTCMGTVLMSVNRCLNLCAGYASTRAFDVTRHKKRTHDKPATRMTASTANAVLSRSDAKLLPALPPRPPPADSVDVTGSVLL